MAGGFFGKLRERLGKSRDGLVGGVRAVFGGRTRIDEDIFEKLEEVLIQADLGVDTTLEIIERMRIAAR